MVIVTGRRNKKEGLLTTPLLSRDKHYVVFDHLQCRIYTAMARSFWARFVL